MVAWSISRYVMCKGQQGFVQTAMRSAVSRRNKYTVRNYSKEKQRTGQ
jgi:hypothetical protein